MHFPDRRPDQSEERILPLINVVFLLLIFFMVTGTLSIAEPFDVKPPRSQSQVKDEPDVLVILMAGDGRIALNNHEMTEAELFDQIASHLQNNPQTLIALKADGQLPANQMVRFTQVLYGIDVKKLRLLTKPEEL